MAFGKLGSLGDGFGRLGSSGGTPTPPAPPGDAPTLQFDDELNSQLLVLLEDF